MPPTTRRTTGIRRPRVAGRPTPQSEASTVTEVLDPPAMTSTGVRRAKGKGLTRTTTEAAPTEALAPDEVTTDTVDAPEQDLETTTEVEAPTQPDSPDDPPADAGPTVVLTKPARPQGRSARAARPATEVVAPEAETERVVDAPAGPTPLRRIAEAPVTTRSLVVWGAVALVLVLAASVFGAFWYNREHGGSAANRALIDVGATSQVAQQVGDAVKTVYSYDFARLDENEKNARAVITPEFEQQFGQLFSEVRARAPQQKAVVTATVALTGVRQLSDDTAVVVIFMNQIATRTAESGPQQQLASAGRLTVTAKKIDGTWKIADVQAV